MADNTCLLVLRWGTWPPWISVPVQMMAAQQLRNLRFLLLGDEPPLVHPGLPPSLVRFKALSLKHLRARTQRTLGVAPNSLSVSGFHSKMCVHSCGR